MSFVEWGKNRNRMSKRLALSGGMVTGAFSGAAIAGMIIGADIADCVSTLGTFLLIQMIVGDTAGAGLHNNYNAASWKMYGLSTAATAALLTFTL